MSSTIRKVKPTQIEEQEVTKINARSRGKTKVGMPVWTGEEYARLAPGIYTAVAVRVIGPEYLKRWSRQSVGIAFCPLTEPDAEVVLFFNLGDGQPKRGSDYYREWTRANGMQPMKGQAMDPNIFLEGQIYEIEVYDADMDQHGKRKSDAEVYSKVKRIISVQRRGEVASCVVPFSGKRGSVCRSNPESSIWNHESTNQQSTNQVGHQPQQASPEPGECNAHYSQPKGREVRLPLRPTIRT